jgi:hypothetical protein
VERHGLIIGPCLPLFPADQRQCAMEFPGIIAVLCLTELSNKQKEGTGYFGNEKLVDLS